MKFGIAEVLRACRKRFNKQGSNNKKSVIVFNAIPGLTRNPSSNLKDVDSESSSE